MLSDNLKILAGVFLLLLAAYYMSSSPFHRYPAGVIASLDPIQNPTSGGESIKIDDFLIQPQAHYDIRARLIRSHIYWFDTESKIAPIDFTVAWGQASDQAVQDKIQVSLFARYFSWHYDGQSPIDPGEIARHMANMHLIPANDRIEKVLRRTSEGEFVHLVGYLVQVSREDGWHWQSSLTRDDQGAGSCELMYVERAEVYKP